MNKLRNDIMVMKIQLNSSYGMSGIGTSLYDEMLKKRDKFFKIQKRFLKIKRLYEL